MSDLLAPASRSWTIPGRWALRFSLGCLALALSPVLLQGLSDWRNDGQIRGVVRAFFQAVANGRTADALSYYSDAFRATLRESVASSSGHTGVATDDVLIQIVSVDQPTDTTAKAEVSISKQGFSLRPTVHLQRTKDSPWRIVRIEGVDVDPRWSRIQSREADDLAEELSEKLLAPRDDAPAKADAGT